MQTLLSSKIVQARKDYPCDACYVWCESGFSLNDCKTDDQKLIVESAIADNFKILKCQLYLKQTGIYDGGFYTVRLRPGMDSVCADLELYPED